MQYLEPAGDLHLELVVSVLVPTGGLHPVPHRPPLQPLLARRPLLRQALLDGLLRLPDLLSIEDS